MDTRKDSSGFLSGIIEGIDRSTGRNREPRRHALGPDLGLQASIYYFGHRLDGEEIAAFLKLYEPRALLYITVGISAAGIQNVPAQAFVQERGR
jgi:hypothetical protein